VGASSPDRRCAHKPIPALLDLCNLNRPTSRSSTAGSRRNVRPILEVTGRLCADTRDWVVHHINGPRRSPRPPLYPTNQALRRRAAPVVRAWVGVSFSFFPGTGNNRLGCRLSPPARRFGFAAVPVSCVRLRLSALIRSSTGAGVAICFGLTGRPFIFASISSRSAS
jgi:hypothetical protein